MLEKPFPPEEMQVFHTRGGNHECYPVTLIDQLVSELTHTNLSCLTVVQLQGLHDKY